MAAFLANENVPALAVASARGAGFDVLWMSETAPGTNDPDVLQQSVAQRRVLITFDRDFGLLAFRLGASASRLSSPDYVARFIVAVLSEPIAWEGNFCVAQEGRIRVTPLP
jgi:hypothetical protein